MYVQKSKQFAVGLLVTMLFLVGSVTPVAHAQLITDEQVEEQKRELMLSLVETLRQDVKLLQMLVIQRLEARVEQLEALVDANK